MIELLRSKIGMLHGAEFEGFIRRLLPTVSSDYEHLTDTRNHIGRVTQGPVDLHAYKKTNDRYIAVLCSGQITGLQAKVLDDIQKLKREDCEIRDKIDQVVVCLSAPGSANDEVYRAACARHGWSATIYSIDRLAHLANESPEVVESLCAIELAEMRKKLAIEADSLRTAALPVKQRFYDCGERIGRIRAKLAMSASRFIDLVEYDSEKRLAFLESQTIDMNQAEIKRVCEATGVSVDWLTHGEKSMFPVETISTYHWEAMKWLKDASPTSLHMLINCETQQLVLLAHLHSKNWKIYHLAFNLDFAAWHGDHHHIPDIYSMLKQLADDYAGRIFGRIVSREAFSEIISGETSPAHFMNITNANGAHWFDDIFDVEHKYPIAENYEDWYGKWFTNAQEYFKRGLANIRSEASSDML